METLAQKTHQIQGIIYSKGSFKNGGDAYLLPIPATHHPVFRFYRPWSGLVPANYMLSFSGSLIRREFDSRISPQHSEQTVVQGNFPRIDEDYFGWIDILEAVEDAADQLVVVELGAGYGKWSVAAACAARTRRPELKVKLVAVEAEPTHFDWMALHFSDNGLDPSCHTLINSPVNGTGGDVSFTIGHAAEWYGQSIIPPGHGFGNWPEGRETRMSAITLEEAVDRTDVIDIVHMDVQGVEGEIIAGSVSLLNSRVRRIHIGTHGHNLENDIYRTLTNEGWFCVHSYRALSTVATEFGDISFQDGVQGWINPRLF